MQLTGRRATVVLVHAGEVLGVLPPIMLDLPWWQEAHDLVAAVRKRDGLDISVLRLLGASSKTLSGGEVTYLAETDRLPLTPLAAWPGDPLADQPLRQTWARPGGPAALVGWAVERLTAHGRPPTGPSEQMRTWNLSALWRIPTGSGRVWLKAVPDFFAHEGAVINWIGAAEAPELIDFAPGRALITDIPGQPNHDVAAPAALQSMVELLIGLQQRGRGGVDELLGLGVPDRRLATALSQIAAVVEQRLSGLALPEQRRLAALVEGLPERLTAIADCGVPDTLVHGDFHPGNVVGTFGSYLILDWGDSFVGHPLIDELAFVERLSPALQAAARGWFVDAWRRIEPGSDPDRAAELLDPLVALLAAVMYARFCDLIEPDEQSYHRSDVTRMLRAAAAASAP